MKPEINSANITNPVYLTLSSTDEGGNIFGYERIIISRQTALELLEKTTNLGTALKTYHNAYNGTVLKRLLELSELDQASKLDLLIEVPDPMDDTSNLDHLRDYVNTSTYKEVQEMIEEVIQISLTKPQVVDELKEVINQYLNQI